MITENGTIKTSVKQDENLYNELNKNVHNLGILYIVCGAIIFALGVLLLGISIFEGTDDWNIIMLVVGALFVVIGIFFLLTCRNAARTGVKMNRVEELEFFDGYLIEKEYTDGELTTTCKLYYKWIVRIRETKNFLFIYNTRVTAAAVDKNSLPLNELNAIRSLLNRAPQSVPAVNTPSAATPPPEPFTDMTDNKED